MVYLQTTVSLSSICVSLSAVIFTQIVINSQMRGPLRQQNIVLYPPSYLCHWWYRKTKDMFKIFNFSPSQFLGSTFRLFLASGSTTHSGEIYRKYTLEESGSIDPGSGPQNCKRVLGCSLMWLLRWMVSQCDSLGFLSPNPKATFFKLTYHLSVCFLFWPYDF